MQQRRKKRFHLNDSVIAKEETLDPDFGTDISGWQGRIKEIDEHSEPDHLVYLVAWDSKTLSRMEHDPIARSEEEGLDWTGMYLYDSDVEPAVERDTEEDVDRMIQKLRREVQQGFSI